MSETVTREEFQDHIQAVAIQRDQNANDAAILRAHLAAANRKIAELEKAAGGTTEPSNAPADSAAADKDEAPK